MKERLKKIYKCWKDFFDFNLCGDGKKRDKRKIIKKWKKKKL